MNQSRVMVVDDQEDYRVLMSGHLRRKGYDVTVAEDGEQALEKLRNGTEIDVLVTDLMMPSMGGLELLKEAKEEDPYLEVVVISGAGTLESAISSMRMGGAYDYLPKPLDSIGDLSLAVSRAAEHRSLRVEQERLQAQISAERERLQWVIENTGDALISSEDGRSISLANPAAEELFGSDPIVKQDAEDVLPAPIGAVLENWKRFELLGPMVTEVAWPEDRVQMLSLTTSGDDAAGWVMLLREVTELRKLQRLKMSLLAQTAAEVREPLAGALSSMVELNELPESKAEQFTGAVQAGMNHLGAIRSWTEQVLDLVELEARSARDREGLALPELIENVVEVDRPELLLDKDIEVDLDLYEDDGPLVHPDVARKLVLHLLNQAAWRAPAGDRIELTLRRQGRQVWLTLRDGGEPLLQGGGTALFESYLALEADPPTGVGLSLAMVKSAADVLGAHVWLQGADDEDVGNTFIVTLPVEEGEQGADR